MGDHWRSLYVPWQFVYQWSLVAFEPMLSECAQLFISSRGCEVDAILIFYNDAEKISTYDPRRKEDTLGEFLVLFPIAEGGHYRQFLGGVWSLARHTRTKR